MVSSPSRRDLLRTAAVASTLSALPSVHAAGSDVLKIGLVGCGGRGTGAATQALAADPQVKLVAMADAFQDRLDGSFTSLLAKKGIAEKVDVKPDAKFVGFDAYKSVIEQSDVVLLTTPRRQARVRRAIHLDPQPA